MSDSTETVPSPEAPDVAELRRTLGLSIRNVLRSELGHEQPFDPHSWRCADKVRHPGPCGCADEVADMAVDAAVNALPAMLDAATELAHMTEARDNARAEVERLTAKLDAIEADDDKLSIMFGWLVYNVGEHTCGGYGPESGYAHEPGCGYEPVIRLDKLEGWPGEKPLDGAES